MILNVKQNLNGTYKYKVNVKGQLSFMELKPSEEARSRVVYKAVIFSEFHAVNGRLYGMMGYINFFVVLGR